MNNKQRAIIDLLNADPLHEAEQFTGKDYKQDERTVLLGLGISMHNSEKKECLLKSIGDTTFSNKLVDYLLIVTSFGFEIIYNSPFECDGRNEMHYILWHKELSLLLNFDTFTWEGKEPSVNGGHLYYNWSPHNHQSNHGLTSSGGFFFEKEAPHVTMFGKDFGEPYYIPNYPTDAKYVDDWKEYRRLQAPIDEEQLVLMQKAIAEGKRIVWVGNHDCREALITNIKQLFEGGLFVTKWKKCSFPWLTNYSDHKGTNHLDEFKKLYEKTKSIISTFPDYVKSSIGEYNK